MMQKSDADILIQRAKALASARADSSSYIDAAHDRYLVAVCGTERIVVALESVVEVFRPSSITPIPRSVAPLWGLTPWRGSILPVIVIGQSLPEQGSGVIITLATGPRVIAGLWANEVEEEIAIGKDEIHAASAATGIRESLVSGVTSDAKSVFDAESLARLLDERTKEKDRTPVHNSTGTQV
ncbi:MAG TPA: chemotaxis protein CheW [Gemmatimonadaceae bacterium]|nr:chemotaxis protein CheW [Gemmatimonadaceae bacterium]